MLFCVEDILTLYYYTRKSIFTIFTNAMAAGRRGTERPGAGKGAAGAGLFCCYVQSVISLMKWSKTQGEIATDGNFRKCRARMPFISAPAGLTIFARFISEI